MPSPPQSFQKLSPLSTLDSTYARISPRHRAQTPRSQSQPPKSSVKSSSRYSRLEIEQRAFCEQHVQELEKGEFARTPFGFLDSSIGGIKARCNASFTECESPICFYNRASRSGFSSNRPYRMVVREDEPSGKTSSMRHSRGGVGLTHSLGIGTARGGGVEEVEGED